MLAEVSYPSTGLGMELGWAHLYKTPILALHQEDKRVGGSIRVVTDNIISYKDAAEMIAKLEIYLKA